MSYYEPVWLRAERLRVLIAAIGEEPTMLAGEMISEGLAPGGWSYYMADIDPEEYAPELDLAWECAQIAQARREREWTALERLGELTAAGEGEDAETRILSLPDGKFRQAALALNTLGWIERKERT